MNTNTLIASFTDSFDAISLAAESYQAAPHALKDVQVIEDPANTLRVLDDMALGVTPIKAYVIGRPEAVMGIIGVVAKTGLTGLASVVAFDEERFYTRLVNRQCQAAPHSAFTDIQPRELPTLTGFVKRLFSGRPAQ